ncbi:MAG: divalent-cation tolerance protein CutA [Candidatus Rokubacteria bacterium]|nr:divalent-cation tolerance protein CutA [Candidatus Rokubacteria bacterium]
MTATDTLVVLVTTSSAEEGQRIARALVAEHLAACVNVLPGVRSVFFWDGQLQEAAEALLVVKTRRECYEALQQRVLELHGYSVPEVLALSVETGSPAYLAWVGDTVRTEGG